MVNEKGVRLAFVAPEGIGDLAALLAALDQVPPAELPEAIGALEAAKAWARLRTPAPAETRVSESDGLLDVAEVARRTRDGAAAGG